MNHHESRLSSYVSEFDQPLENVIEEFLARPGVSFLDSEIFASKLAQVVRQWEIAGGSIHLRNNRTIGRPKNGIKAYHKTASHA